MGRGILCMLLALGLGGCTLLAPDGEDAPPSYDTDGQVLDETSETLDLSDISPVTSVEQKLVQMSALEFYATQSVALRIAKACESLNFDLRRNADLVALRGDPEGRFGIVVRRGTVRAKAAELTADLVEKHGVDLATSDLCDVGRAEISEGTALSGTLRAVG